MPFEEPISSRSSPEFADNAGMDTCDMTLGELESEFLAHLERETAGGRCSEATIRYYRTQLGRFVAAVGPERPVSSIVALDLERVKTNWHSVQAPQRLFNWAADVGLVVKSPFKKVAKPEAGSRKRVLARAQLVRLLRRARRAFREFLLAMRGSIARPQEIRAVCWSMLSPDGACFVLTEFKGKNRRRDKDAVRVICLDARVRRLLARLRRRRNPGPDDFVFLNSRGLPWTNNGIRSAMRRLRKKADLVAGDGMEAVVAYTLRHTAATAATANGVRDRMLADLMGHTSTKTTARYQHLQPADLVAAIQQATRKRA